MDIVKLLGIICFVAIFHGAGLGLIIGGSILVHNGNTLKTRSVNKANCTMVSYGSYYQPKKKTKRNKWTNPQAYCSGNINVFPLWYDFEKNATCMFAGEEGCECSIVNSCKDSLQCINNTCNIKPTNKVLCETMDATEVKRWSNAEGDKKAREACPRYLPKPNKFFACYYKSGLMDSCSNLGNTIGANKAKEAIFTSKSDLDAHVTGRIVGGSVLIGFGILWWCCVCCFSFGFVKD